MQVRSAFNSRVNNFNSPLTGPLDSGPALSPGGISNGADWIGGIWDRYLYFGSKKKRTSPSKNQSRRRKRKSSSKKSIKKRKR
jgi:hypothetical protein